jgi:hypothetical protein
MTGAQKIQGALNKINFRAVALGAAAMGGTIALISKRAIDAASDLEEVTAKFETVFGEQSRMAEQWAQVLVDSYAMSTREARKYLAEMQDLLVPMGMNAKAAGRMSSEVVKLAADLGSFNNLRTEDVMRDIQSALVGNFETMKKYGVVLNQAVITQKALDLGLIRSKDQLDANIRAQVAYKLIVEASRFAVGDLARTSGSYANQTKKALANIEDMTAELGTNLLPAATKIVSMFNEWVKTNKKLITQDVPGYIGSITDGLAKAVGVYQSLPEGITGAAGIGIVGRALFGSWAPAKLALAFTVINDLMKNWGMDVKSTVDDFKELSLAMDRLFGKKPDDKLLASSRDILPDMLQKSHGANLQIKKDISDVTTEIKIQKSEVDKLNDSYIATLPALKTYRDSWEVSGDRTFTDEQLDKLENLNEAFEDIKPPIDNFKDDTLKAYDDIDRATDSLSSNISSSLASTVTQGKLDFKSLADSIVSDFVRIQSHSLISKLFGAIGGGGGSLPTTVRGGEGGGYGFQHGGYIGERVKGFGAASGKSYEFHPNEWVVPSDKMGGNVAVEVNVVNNLGKEAEVQQSTRWANPNKMVAEIVLNETITSRSFRNGMRRF